MYAIKHVRLAICLTLTGCTVDASLSSLQSAAAPETIGQSRGEVSGTTTPGTWTPMVNPPPILSGAVALQLLTDGTVLLNEPSKRWFRLTPDINGSYINGTWSQVGSTHRVRFFMPSTMLKDGRYWIGGGENVERNNHATIEIYDPVTDTWTPGPDMQDPIGDTAASILADGRVLCSSYANSNTYFFDPAANAWSFAGLIGTGGGGGEKGWTLLQDGTVLDAFDVASRYNPATNVWTATGALPVSLAAGSEVGPMSLLHSGKVLQFGAAVSPNVGHTAIFDPSMNTWAPGADAPDGLQFADSSASVLVNGNVLCSTTQFLAGGEVAAMWEYNPNAAAGTPVFTKVADGTAAFPGNPTPLLEPIMLPLPNGQVLVTQEPQFSMVAAFSIYTPSGGPDASWRPSLSSISSPVSGVFTLTGTQLNGLTNGASFGDDFNMASAYPIVYLTDAAGHVYYARSYNFDQMAPKPQAAGSCNFTLRSSVPNGTYDVHVAATGIASSNTIPLTISGVHVTSMIGGFTNSIPGGPGTFWSVSLSAPAPAGGTVVNLSSSNPSVATVPATVTIPQGFKAVSFRVTSVGYGYTNITAETATPHPAFKPASRAFGWRIASLTGDVAPQSGGRTATWTVEIDNQPSDVGVVVNLQSSNTAAVTVPATVTVPPGAKSVSFPVTLTTSGGFANISASLLGSSMSWSFGYKISFTPPHDISFPPNWDAPQAAGGTQPWAVWIDQVDQIDQLAPSGGLVVQLQSSDVAIATVQPTLTIPSGFPGTSFLVTVGNNPVVNPATITASLPGSITTAPFGYRIVDHQVVPSTVRIGSTAAATIVLNGVAPPAGLPITYENRSPSVASISVTSQTIASGQSQGGYNVVGLGTQPASDIVRARIGTAGPFRNVGFLVEP